jgi:transposase-like protein
MPAPKRKRRLYSPLEIQAALTTLAFFGGNTTRTAVETGIAQQTLHDWRSKDHRDLYLEIQEREAPKLEAIAAGQAREVILRVAETEHRILDRLAADETDPETGEVTPPSAKTLSELAGALQRVTTAKGINTTKLLELTGRPTSIVEHREGNDILRALGARIPGLVVDSTAEEIPATQNRSLPVASGVSNAREPVEAPSKHGVEPRTDRSG